mgnify:CR=1 FL=1
MFAKERQENYGLVMPSLRDGDTCNNLLFRQVCDYMDIFSIVLCHEFHDSRLEDMCVIWVQ